MLEETATIRNFWTDKASERKRIEGLLEEEINFSKIKGVTENAGLITTEIMKLAKNRLAELR
jgi:hypothetical protein